MAFLSPIEIVHTRHHQFAKKAGTKTVCGICGESRFMPQHGPVSLNQFGKNKSSFLYNQAKQAWQRELIGLLTEAEMPRSLHVLVEGQMCFSDRQLRDQGNYRFFIEKALGDALQAGGWLGNDTWDAYEFGQLAKTHKSGESWVRLLLFVTPMGSVQAA